MDSWKRFLKIETNKEYYKKLNNFINKEYQNKKIFPLKEEIFRALELTDFDKVKVVILGQDPYHNEEQANGLAFSVRKGVKLPPSLRNIFKELEEDLGIKNNNGDLTKWAKQGVLLINSVLTVEKDKPASHKNMGWETFTDEMIKCLNGKKDSIVFVLWGNYAKSKIKFITNKNHYVLESTHPSPLSYYKGFRGSEPFSKINKILITNKKEPISWKI